MNEKFLIDFFKDNLCLQAHASQKVNLYVEYTTLSSISLQE